MIFKGRVRVTLSASCGWLEEMFLNFSVDCADPSKVREAVSEKHGGLAESWHGQSGCEHECHLSLGRRRGGHGRIVTIHPRSVILPLVVTQCRTADAR